MSFINVSKVTLDSEGDLKKGSADVMLLMASLVHEAVQKGDQEEALRQLDMLRVATANLNYAVTKNSESLNKEMLENLHPSKVVLTYKDDAGIEVSEEYSQFFVYGVRPGVIRAMSNDINDDTMCMISKMMDVRCTNIMQRKMWGDK